MYLLAAPLYISWANSSRRRYFWILPVTVRGYAVTNFMYLGFLKWAIFWQQCWWISSFVSAGSDSLMTAAISSPILGSGTPITWASSTPSMLLRKSSISLGNTFSPPRMIISLIRPTMLRYPWESSVARSPDFIQPSQMDYLVLFGSCQQPCMTQYPRTQNQPGSLIGTVFPWLSTTLASIPGRMRPTVRVFCSRVSSGLVWNDTGEVSVMPQQMVMSRSPRVWQTSSISFSGQREPAMMPVRSRSWQLTFLACLMYSQNMVGTPQMEVAWYSWQASRAFCALKPRQGQTTAMPRVRAARLPMTIPKQWQRGTATQMLSCWVCLVLSPRLNPLFRMLRWVRVAPLGCPVVPLVNWIFVAASAGMLEMRSSIRPSPSLLSTEWKGRMLRVPGKVRSMQMTCLREGRPVAGRQGLSEVRSGISCSRRRMQSCLWQVLSRKRADTDTLLMQYLSSYWRLAGLMLTRMRSAMAVAI